MFQPKVPFEGTKTEYCRFFCKFYFDILRGSVLNLWPKLWVIFGESSLAIVVKISQRMAFVIGFEK